MKMKELLIPVGDYLSLEYAVANGADAVYLGMKNFNARSYAKNFTEEELKKAIRLCHLYGVKIYITMNTLVKDNEVEQFLNTISTLHQYGVDAVIMQDFGMICLVREMFPNLEIHASTQANVLTKEAVELFYNIGVKRVVLPREMSLEEIEKIDIPIEKEVFIHGALCMSYSGCCLISSMLGSRSGNRGECTGCCRLFYTLYKKDKKIKEGYLLSTKELNTSNKIKDLLSSGITSFKVEGRMKSPLYVGFITRFYRRLIDGKMINYEEELEKLKILFNRQFTLGHLFHDDIRNTSSPNHLGLKIGTTLKVTPKKIKIKLSYPLYQEDGLRFQNASKGFIANYIYDENHKLISSAKKNQIIFLDNKIGLKTKDEVYKTTSKKLKEDLLTLENRKIEVSMHIIARKNDPLTLEVTDGTKKVFLQSVIVQQAKNIQVTKERIKSQLQKLGSTPFVLKNVTWDIDENIFIQIKDINELRRNAIEELKIKRMEEKVNYKKQPVKFEKYEKDLEQEISIEVQTEEKLKEVMKKDVTRIYVPIKLYNKYQNEKRLYLVEDFQKKSASKMLRKFYHYPKKEDICDYTFNVFNIYTVYYLLKLGYKRVTLSVELSNEEIFYLFAHFKEVFHFTPSLEVIVYDRVVVMNIKGNILDLKEEEEDYYLKDHYKRCFKAFYQNGYTYIYNYETRKRKLEKLSTLPISLRYQLEKESNQNAPICK